MVTTSTQKVSPALDEVDEMILASFKVKVLPRLWSRSEHRGHYL